VVDKINGGKADALNVGINVALNNYLVCIDVDCVLEQDGLLKMIKPFLEQTYEKVIATGGVIRIANSCIIENGHLIKVRTPEDYLPRMQSVEYIRAFILGRMAWSRLNGLMLISGAFGAFDRDTVIQCGGYNIDTVGEDMELVVRMRRHMEEQEQKYSVMYIPDPLCWTEVPSSLTVLGRQRDRWQRGLIETLLKHKKMFFNPEYKLLGMLSYPYWFFFELCSPVIEFLGFMSLVFFILIGVVSWQIFFAYLLFVVCFAYLFSFFAILMEVITYNQYKRRTDIFQLLMTSLTEPFYFHPFVFWNSFKGCLNYIRKKKDWGEMTRKGFEQAPIPVKLTTTEKAEIHLTENNDTKYMPAMKERKSTLTNFAVGFYASFSNYLSYAFILFSLLLAARLFEIIADLIKHNTSGLLGKIAALAFLKDVSFFTQYALPVFVVFALLRLIHEKFAKIFFIVVSVLAILIQVALSQYFLTTLVPLGGDFWSYSWADITQTVGAAGGVPTSMIMFFVIALILIIAAFIYFPKRVKTKLNGVITFSALLVFIMAMFVNAVAITGKWMPGTEYGNNLSINKSYFFYRSSLQHFFPHSNELDYTNDSGSARANNYNFANFNYVDEQQYPFLHTLDTTSSVLSPFFNKAATKPNIVIILVEGLGRAFTNNGAYLGNFTPFIDSLSQKSLYWENFLSEGGRTFAVLPSVLGSLPFAKNGFNELANNMPEHLSLMSLLEHNGYQTSFNYGGNSQFDNMGLFMQKNNVGSINDEKTFSSSYEKLPPSLSGFSWGYGDKELFRHYFEKIATQQQPYANVLLTVSTHSPFLINEQDKYFQKFEQRINELGFDAAAKEKHRIYKNQYASILFMDDAIHNFIDQYKSRADFNNTVFLITGDHRMPEIPMSTKIDRYHVPLIIYSPLLKRTAKFSSISTHFDITPSLLMWLKNDYHLQVPSTGSWMGSGLDTFRTFRNIHAYPFMHTKSEVSDFVMGEYMLNGTDLYKISGNMDLEPEQNEAKANELKAAFNLFMQKNEKMIQGAKLIPDSLYKAYLPKK
jgi:phosphoglycerol transferase MdoB-like AlkP superfamily enzyme